MASVGSILNSPAYYLVELVRQAQTFVILQREGVERQDKMIRQQAQMLTALNRLARAVEGSEDADGGDGS